MTLKKEFYRRIDKNRHYTENEYRKIVNKCTLCCYAVRGFKTNKERKAADPKEQIII